MKRLLLVSFFILAINIVYAQKKQHKGKSDKIENAQPKKGDKVIIATYNLNGDSLYRKLIKSAAIFGYTLDKRDDEVLLFTTEMKPIKHISYKIRVHVIDSTARISGEYLNSIGVQIGSIKTEQKPEILKYESKMFVTRNAFDEVLNFIGTSSPISTHYAK